MNVTRFDPSIFKAYDIRGVVPGQLNWEAAFQVGVGLAKSNLLRNRGTVAVGYDARLSSRELFDGVTKGLATCGVNAVSIGLCTTPMLYFAVNELETDGGVMITASHNPREYNGFKLVGEKAIPIGKGTGLERVKAAAMDGTPTGAVAGQVSAVDISPRYVAFFAERFQSLSGVRMVIDAGNGTAGPILTQVLSQVRADYVPLFFEPDGRFPNHEANPLRESNLEDLRETLRHHLGRIGVAFDGDGDRVCFLDESGRVVRGDITTSLLAKGILAEEGPSRILYDLRSSRIVAESVRAAGGEPVKTCVGHSFVKAEMRKLDAVFAGELSYHFYFRDFFYCESGVYALLKLASLVSETATSLEDLVAPLLKYVHTGEVNFKIDEKGEAMRDVERHYSNGTITRLDGLTVEFADWWFNLRPSNTEPYLRLNLEAVNQQVMADGLQEITRLLTRYGSRCE